MGRTEIHEAAHTVVALALHWTLSGVTVEGGVESNGCCRVAWPPVPLAVVAEMDHLASGVPFSLWPEAPRRHVETKALIWMSGELGALVLAPRRPGRYHPPLHERATTLAAELPEALPEPEPEIAAVLRQLVDTPGTSDAEEVARLAYIAHGHSWAAMGSWLGFLETQARAIIEWHAPQIEYLAAVLSEHPMLDGDAVLRLLDDANLGKIGVEACRVKAR
jgi:hypothetical protein